MAYMIYQQYTTAIKEGYADHPGPELATQAAHARSCREWLASLAITPSVRDDLVEQMNALEEAFNDLLRMAPTPGGDD